MRVFISFSKTTRYSCAIGWQGSAGTHRHHYGDGSCKAPDQGIVHRQPTEIRVSIAFGVQTHRQTWTDPRKNRQREIFFIFCLNSLFTETILSPEDDVTVKVTKAE